MVANEKAVLLLHGWPGTSDDFHLVRQVLPVNLRTIAPDLAGYGTSFKGNLAIEQASAGAHADDLIGFIKSNNIGRPVIAGYDIGSRIAQAIANEYPDMLGGLVITPG